MVLMAGADGTLEAALQAAGLGPRAAIDAHDLWVPRGGGHGADILDRGGTGWRAWLGQDSSDQAVSHVVKDIVLRAAFDDVDGDGEEDEPITVTGTRNVNEGTGDETGGGYGAGFYPGSTGYEGELGDGGSTLDSPPVAKETPCVSSSPSGVPLQELNNIALAMSIKISEFSNQNIEYGAILYLHDGVLYSTQVFTSGQTGEIDWNIGLHAIPSGSIIVGTLHSHPDIEGITDTIPSYTDIMEGTNGRDWRSYLEFLGLNWHGITTDPNMLMYIYSKEDSKTHVYDGSDRNTKHPSCTLQD